MGLAGALAETLILPLARRSALLRELVAYIHDRVGRDGAGELRERFVSNGRHSQWTQEIRGEIADRFAEIHRQVDIHSGQSDALIMAEAVLSLDADGDLVECGCYAGGSTAKLSILAKLLGKRLFVFDSFEGFPPATLEDRGDIHTRYTRRFNWDAGAANAPLAVVKQNVQAVGELSACVFIPGWFRDTMTRDNLPAKVCFAYTDVALPSSTKDAFTALWPLLTERGVYFSRDVGFVKVLQQLMDEQMWRELDEFPPVLFGGGYGIRNAAPNLGFMVKGKSVSAEYINSLTINKVTS